LLIVNPSSESDREKAATTPPANGAIFAGVACHNCSRTAAPFNTKMATIAKDEMGGKRIGRRVLAIGHHLRMLVFEALQLFLQDVLVLVLTLLRLCLQDAGVLVPRSRRGASGRAATSRGRAAATARAEGCYRPSGSPFGECVTAGIRDARAVEKN
jgi:hypothetical protein